MKKIFLVTNHAGYWGKGTTLIDALKNANTEVEHNVTIDVFTKPDGEFTPDEYKEFSSNGWSVSYPQGAQCLTLGTLRIQDLPFFSNLSKIATYFVNKLDAETKPTYGQINAIEKVLEQLKVTLY